MANYTADQLTAGTDASVVVFAGAPAGGGNSVGLSALQIMTSAILGGAGKLPTNSGGAGYDCWIGAGDAGATGRGGNVYVQVGAQLTSGGNGSFILLDSTGATALTFDAVNTLTFASSTSNIQLGSGVNLSRAGGAFQILTGSTYNTFNGVDINLQSTKITFGGTTSSFPALKRSGTAVAFRLGDDSADGPITCSYVRTVPVAVASLPAAATAGQGARAFVTDANATTYASVVAGGGANTVPVYSNGTNWLIG